MKNIIPLLATLLTCTLVGCSSNDPMEKELSAVLSNKSEEKMPEESKRLEFDFGSVIARDQILRHEFRVENQLGRPARIISSKANAPCCSSLGKLPESIASGGSALIPVFLKAGHILERKRLTFEFQTDCPSMAPLTLVLTARFMPEWDIEQITPRAGPLRIGQESKTTYRLVGRRKAGEGLRAPSQVDIAGSLKIESLGAAHDIEGSDGVIENSRQLDVVMMAQATPGEKLGELQFRWADGTSRVHQVVWVVKPSLQVVPSVLVVKPEPRVMEAAIEIRSEDRKFRVIKVTGNIVNATVPASKEAATSQSLRVPIDLNLAAAGAKPEIEIQTDLPDQPNLTLGVLVLPPE